MFERVKAFFNPPQEKAYDAEWFLRFMTIAAQEDGVDRVNDPYKAHAWVNIGISTIAKNIARAEFKCYQGDSESSPDNPVQKMFNNVNPYMSKYQLWEATVSWKKLKGEAFWIFDWEPLIGKPKAIYLVDPQHMHHVLDKPKRNIIKWVYKDGGKEIPFDVDEVIHFHTWNPWNEWRGVSELTSLTAEISGDVSSNKYSNSILRNRSIPSGILSIPDMVEPEEAKRIQEAWDKAHKGKNKAGKIAVLGGGTKFIPTSLSMNDMQFLDSKAFNRQAILAKLGVPPEIVGVHDGKTPLSGGNTKEVMQQFWTVTLIPEIRSIEDKLRTEFFTRFKISLEGRFDLSAIPELQEDEEKRITRMLSEVEKGTLTINEAREQLDRDPVDWGDSWWISMGMRPAGEEAPSMPNPFDNTPVEELFEPEVEKDVPVVVKFPTYTQDYKNAGIEKVQNELNPMVEAYTKDLKKWMYKQRSHFLQIINSDSKAVEDIEDAIDDPEYWAGQNDDLKKIAKKHGTVAMEYSAAEVVALMGDLNITIRPDWDIYNTRAVTMLERRVDKVTQVTETIIDKLSTDIRLDLQTSIEEGWSRKTLVDKLTETVKGDMNIAQNRATTIAKTELGGTFNDSRLESFLDLGITEHEWAHSTSGQIKEPRPDHLISEKRRIGETFSNGLMYPHEPNGPADQVINCSCMTYPVIGED